MGKKKHQNKKKNQKKKNIENKKRNVSNSVSTSERDSKDNTPKLDVSLDHHETENFPLLVPIRDTILQDASFSLPGFVAGEVEELQELHREASAPKSREYGSIPQVENIESTCISPTRLRVIMSSMYLGIFLSALDNTIVSTLLAHIGSEFNSLPRIAWIATAYLLSSATFQPLYGKISDIYGRKPVLTFCNVNFFLGCLICGLARSFWVLVFGRFIAGIGGGGLTSISTITVSDIIPLRNRALYQGICNFYYGLGIALGGVVGGWFVNKAGGWRVAFLFQVPLSIISTTLIIFYLQLPKNCKGNGLQISDTSGIQNITTKNTDSIFLQRLKAIDWSGAITLVVFLFSFLLLTSLGGQDILFSSKTFFILSLIFLASFSLFVYIELYVAKDPILPLSFLKDRSVLGSSLSNWFTMMSLITISYYLPIFFTSVMNMSPYDIGKRMLPNFFSTAFGSLGAGYYMKKTGKYYWFVLSFCFVAVLGCLQIYLIDLNISVWRQYTLGFVPGLGVAVLITIALLSMIAAVPHEHQAVTTSISYAFRSTGCTLGVSIGAAIFRHSLDNLLTKKIFELDPQNENYTKEELLEIIEKASKSTDWVNQHAPKYFKNTIVFCYQLASKKVFLFCLTCSILALLSISIIKEHKLHNSLDRKDEPNSTNPNITEQNSTIQEV